ncbi:3-deoxy-D-manno-octulosonic acid transferase [Sphingobacteriaceae bacterium AH-315-L07]|nr:3-deoxy-D-manno-octulosonic acid transferase [Sphingobacteriaceae bacterium AH-315-L07]
MSELLYNFGIRIFYLGVAISSIWNKKAKQWLAGRQEIFDKLKQAQSSDSIWVHAASLGEFEQALPLIEKLKEQLRGCKIIVTFFSPSGYEVKKDHPMVDHIFYLPLDTARNAEKFISTINPAIAFFIKYEYWYNYLKVLHRKGIPTYVISARFYEEQSFFKWYGGFFRKTLSFVSHFFVQDKRSSDLLKRLGFENQMLTGDTRYDKVFQNVQEVKPNEISEKFKNDKKLLLLGSSWQPEEEILISFLKKNKIDLKVIIAPHKIDGNNVNRLIKNLQNEGIKSICFSEVKDQHLVDYQILIIDNIGMLSSLYQYADFAFIGGAFGTGLHNILEAACFGIPIFFGPEHSNFPEAQEMIDCGGAFNISNSAEFEKVFLELLVDEDKYQAASTSSRNLVENNRGVVNKIFNYLESESTLFKNT